MSEQSPSTPQHPPTPAGPGPSWGWSDGTSRNYFALTAVVGAAISLVLVSPLLALVSSVLSLCGAWWAFKHNGAGLRLVYFAILLSGFTYFIFNQLVLPQL